MFHVCILWVIFSCMAKPWVEILTFAAHEVKYKSEYTLKSTIFLLFFITKSQLLTIPVYKMSTTHEDVFRLCEIVTLLCCRLIPSENSAQNLSILGCGQILKQWTDDINCLRHGVNQNSVHHHIGYYVHSYYILE